MHVGIPIADSAAWARTVAWRRDQLRAVGFCPDLAARLAVDRRYDLHRVLELIDRGCPPALAARIVAPLDGDLAT